MSDIHIQNDLIGLLYSSGSVHDFKPKLKFELIEYETGYYLNITTIDEGLVEFGKVRKHSTSWSKEFTLANIRYMAIRDVLIPMMEQRYSYIL